MQKLTAEAGAPLPESSVYKILDKHLHYHVELMRSYAERNTVEELHEKHLGDPVFEAFGLTDRAFAEKRWAAGFANSCATNLGRFTDKAAKAILAHAFEVDARIILKKLEIKVGDKTEIEETDGVVLVDEIPRQMRARVQTVADKLAKQLPKPMRAKGVGFELRGRYGKNDDTLIQKDEHMATAISMLGAVPVLATFSTKNANGAIRRLSRSWVVTSGSDTIDLISDLTGIDLMAYLKSREQILRPIVNLIKAEAPNVNKIAETMKEADERVERLAD